MPLTLTPNQAKIDAKNNAEHNATIKREITDLENKLIRPVLAKIAGTATAEDEEYFSLYKYQIEEKRKLLM